LDQTNEDQIIEAAEQTAKQDVEKKILNRRQGIFKDFRDLLVVILAFMLVYVLFFRAVVVVGDSMYDTLANGDRLLVLNNFLYRNPKPGDIIVASKDSFRDGECIIKRVIATEGQVVDIDFQSGTVYVDGQALDEPYLFSPTKRPEGVSFPLVVESGCVFVMGDNRMESKDSRDPDIGMVDVREILGKAIFLLWPGAGTEDYPAKFDILRIGGIG
jgi:signal peptidase I